MQKTEQWKNNITAWAKVTDELGTQLEYELKYSVKLETLSTGADTSKAV